MGNHKFEYSCDCGMTIKLSVGNVLEVNDEFYFRIIVRWHKSLGHEQITANEANRIRNG
jgi:hypothetical protein